MRLLKTILPDLCAVLFFVALGFAYFFNPVTKGYVLTGHDHSGGAGAASEMEAYHAAHNYRERTRWTNTLFSGMPTYQMAPSYNSTDRLQMAENIYKLFLPDYVVLVFVMLLGFYIMLRAFDFRAWMAALGAVLWAFSSYYFIIIGAGHIWKFYTLAFIPPTIAGMVLCYRGRYLLGLLLTAFFMALQILSNHVQMTYYFAFVVAAMALAYCPLLSSTRDSRWGAWLKGSAVFALGCIIGIAINASNLFHTWQYSKETMRSKSELTSKTLNAADQTSSGLERSYITAWSYGIGETWSLLIPNVKGGASQPLSQNATAMAKANPTYSPVYQSLGQYWGEQPGTSGPVYVGAFVIFLFVLGCFIVKGPMKWALLGMTLFSILLSWGKNFMPLTDFFLDYVPMYDKFRTVASILVIAEFTIPLLAMLALKQIVEQAERNTAQQLPSLSGEGAGMRPFILSLALTAGFCFLFWLMPDVFFGNYISSSETSMLQGAAQQGYIPQEMLAPIMQNLGDMRRAMFTADAGRSLVIILVGVAILVAYHFRKIKTWAMVACITLLCTADLWDVNKRYLNDAMFSAPQPSAQFFQKTPTDEAILQDTTTYYRVLNLAVSTFNDNTTSYWHKSIGGYHAAKLRRYQELIEARLQPEMMELMQAASATQGRLDSIAGDSLFPVLNMLNMRYAILPTQGGNTVPIQNPWAMGNAWIVSNVLLADNADEELAALDAINPRTTAVIDRRFTELIPPALISSGGVKPASADEGMESDPSQVSTHLSRGRGVGGEAFTLTSYQPNALTFAADVPEEALAVFSDIYYPGWQCTIDGQPADIIRADYVLRAVVMPAGHHTVQFTFDPQSLHVTETIANISLILLLILALALIGWELRRATRPVVQS